MDALKGQYEQGKLGKPNFPTSNTPSTREKGVISSKPEIWVRDSSGKLVRQNAN